MGKILYLEGLRGLCALFVANLHLSIDFNFWDCPPDDMKTSLLVQVFSTHLYQSYNLLVPMFFILSGRVLSIYFLSPDKRQTEKYLAKAFLRRLPRLLFPLMGIIFFNDFLCWIGLSVPDSPKRTFSYSSHFIDPIKYITVGIPYPGGHTAMPHTAWTLFTEYYGSFLTYIISFSFSGFKSKISKTLVLGFVFIWSVMFTEWMSYFVVGIAVTFAKSNSALEKWGLFRKLSFISPLLYYALHPSGGDTMYSYMLIGRLFGSAGHS